MAETSLSMSAVDPRQWMIDTQAWITAHWLDIVLTVGAATTIYILLRLLRGLAKRLRDQTDGHTGVVTIVGRVLARTSHLFMAMVAIRLVVRYANPPALVSETIAFLFIVAASFQVAIWVREIVIGSVEARASADESSESLRNAMAIIRLLVTVAVFAIATIVVLDNVGVNVTAMVAGLGVGGIAIGLAAQGIFSDLFAALSILFDKPFKQGDTIAYDATVGKVERIGLKSTRLQSVTGERKIIANTKLLEKEITSYAALNHRRVSFAFGIIYQTDPSVVEAIPSEIRTLVETYDAQMVRCGFTGFGQSSLDFELVFDVFDDDWDRVFALRHRVGVAILRHFNSAGIEFAYPTQTSFTAAPDGRFILPFHQPHDEDHPPR